MNYLYYGDNLAIMQKQLKAGSVDLIYLDPPFKSDATYNLLYRNMTGKPVPDQAEAFFDTWDLDNTKLEVAYAMPVLMREHGIDDLYINFWKTWVNALCKSQPGLLAYLIYMVQRLVPMKGILRRTGSIYLHCDPTASHYIKVMMDGIFGHQNFRNEIVWKRTGSHGGSRRWGPVHDIILFYSVSDKYTWNKVFQDYDESYLEKFYRHRDGRGNYQIVSLTGAGVRAGDSGKPWRDIDPTDSGRHWAVPVKALQAAYPDMNLPGLSTQEKLELLDKAGLIYWPPKGSMPRQKRYSDEAPGVQVQDIITDIGPIASQAGERLGYPTQKPLNLLKRIISASTNRGDVVFDPFCGCGTTIYAANELERNWIGCDIAVLAIKLVREVLAERYRLVEGTNFKIGGIPVTVEQAEDLARRDPFQFQHWLVEVVGGLPMHRKTADLGISGRVYFETEGRLEDILLAVKPGDLQQNDIKDLRETMERERSAMAGFLSLEEPTSAMRAEAAEAGVYKYNNSMYPRIQLLSVQDILESKRELKTPTKIGTRINSGQQSLPL